VLRSFSRKNRRRVKIIQLPGNKWSRDIPVSDDLHVHLCPTFSNLPLRDTFWRLGLNLGELKRGGGRSPQISNLNRHFVGRFRYMNLVVLPLMLLAVRCDMVRACLCSLIDTKGTSLTMNQKQGNLKLSLLRKPGNRSGIGIFERRQLKKKPHEKIRMMAAVAAAQAQGSGHHAERYGVQPAALRGHLDRLDIEGHR